MKVSQCKACGHMVKHPVSKRCYVCGGEWVEVDSPLVKKEKRMGKETAWGLMEARNKEVVRLHLQGFNHVQIGAKVDRTASQVGRIIHRWARQGKPSPDAGQMELPGC